MRISDWSSDVCSSDLIGQGALDLLRANDFRQDAHFVPVAFFGMGAHNFNTLGPTVDNGVYITAVPWPQPAALWNGVAACVASSSEDRRGGKECVGTCRSRWSPSH